MKARFRRAIVVAAICLSVSAWPAEVPKRALTVKDAIETADLAGNRAGPIVVSPDGRKYATRIVRGHVERNGVCVSLLVGRLDSFNARPPRIVRDLFTSGLELPHGHRYVLKPSVNPLRWMDDEHLVFLWEDERQVQQVLRLNASSGDIRYLTKHATDVIDFELGRGGTLVYVAKPPPQAATSRSTPEGTVVTAADGYALADGELGGHTLRDRKSHEAFAMTASSDTPVELRVDIRNDDTFGMKLSPNEHYALIHAWPEKRPASWSSYLRPGLREGNVSIRFLEEALLDPTGWSGYARKLTQLHLIDLQQGSARPLWDVPTLDPVTMTAEWSPDSSAILIAPTLLPASAGTERSLPDVSVVELDLATGDHRLVPIPADLLSTVHAPGRLEKLRWLSRDGVEVSIAGEVLSFSRSQGEWQLSERKARESAKVPRLTIEVRQTLDSPPALHLIDRTTGRSRQIFDPNPELRTDYELGRVELFRWRIEEGREMKGLLYRPVDFKSGQRYPVVLHVGGSTAVGESKFSLYGMPAAPGLGPSWSIYVAQILANHGIATLIVPRVLGYSPSPQEAAATVRACEAAVRALDKQSLIDPRRVGITGFSRAGWQALHALTHSDLQFAAAIVSDNIDGSYFQATLAPGSLMREGGGPPFGAGLETWLENAPGFNVDRIRTPVRFVSESSSGSRLLGHWEVFARMRQLRLPAELYVIPDVEHGSHNLQNPGQILALKQGAVDWFNFWLNGREEPDVAKAAQYSRWRELRKLRDAALREPRPPLLDWTARPMH